MEFVYGKESHNIIGAALEVHKTLGAGFTEKVYQDALEVELRLMGIPFVREPDLRVQYKQVELASTFKPDFICYGKIIVELKAVKEIEDVFKAQALNYARICNYELAILLNFGKTSLEQFRLPNFRVK